MKQIKFSKILALKAEGNAKEKGLTFGEYIRHLVVNDTDLPVERLDQETEKNVIKSLNDYSKGRYNVLRNKDEIKKYFDKIVKNKR